MASTSVFDRAISALKSNDEVLLRQIYSDLSAKVSACRALAKGEHFPMIGRTLFRDIGAETTYLPQHVKADKSKPTIALRYVYFTFYLLIWC